MSVLIVGLGNPGKDYAQTRHNAGFLAVEALGIALQGKWSLDKRSRAEVLESSYFDQKIILAKPQTFMNLSGQSVASLAATFKLTPEQIWVVSDDVALPLGTIRVRVGGSAGGHNGLKSIIDSLGSEGFVRYKIGINEPPANIPLENYVVQRFSKSENAKLKTVLAATQELILKNLASGVSETSIQS